MTAFGPECVKKNGALTGLLYVRQSVDCRWTQATDGHRDQAVEQGRMLELRWHVFQYRADGEILVDRDNGDP